MELRVKSTEKCPECGNLMVLVTDDSGQYDRCYTETCSKYLICQNFEGDENYEECLGWDERPGTTGGSY